MRKGKIVGENTGYKYNVDLTERIDKKLFKKPFDLIIIGGGINGAGVARDAAQRGLKVLLLEKEDYAYGCTSHSTRLIHGGLRYLEHFEFSLVHESLKEREILLKNYPHLVHPLGLFIPVYEGNRNNLLKINAGMMLYDMLSFNKSLDKYKTIKKSRIKEMEIGIELEDLKGGVFYHDAQVPFVERLCLENILTAQEYGAVVLNHCEVTEVICEASNGKYTAKGVKFKDKLDRHTPYIAHATHVVNMSGPWVDSVNKILRQPNGMATHELKKQIGGTKGSHIMVKDFKGAPKNHGIYVETRSDQRPIFILPFRVGLNEPSYLIGTTDIFISDKESLDQIEISEAEIKYLLKEVNELFPDAKLKREDIIKSFCGVRPLPYSDPDSSEAAKVTRKHSIYKHQDEGISNFYSVIGGKITTFRNLAKEVVDLFSFEESQTDKSPAVGSLDSWGMDFEIYVQEKIAEYTEKYNVTREIALHLIILYGSRAKAVLDLCLEDPTLKNRIDIDYEDIEAQIVYAIRHEKAYTIEDILERRLSIGLLLDKKYLSKYNNGSVYKVIINHFANEFELTRVQRQDLIDKYTPKTLFHRK